MKLIILLFFLSCLLFWGCAEDIMEGKPEAGDLDAIPDTVDFGLYGMERDLVLYSTWNGYLSWELVAAPEWIDPELEAGWLSPYGVDTVALQINRPALQDGKSEDSLTIQFEDLQVMVRLMVEQASVPLLGELPVSLDFGIQQTSLPLTIYNSGRDTLTWSIITGNPLFSVSPDSGATLISTPVTAYFDRANAPEGLSQSTLTVLTNGGYAYVQLSAMVGGFQSHWLSYCGAATNYYEAQSEDYFYAVRFDRPTDWQAFRISKVRIQFHTLSNVLDDVSLRCWDVIESGGILKPDLADLRFSTGELNTIQGWNEWNVDWTLDLPIFCVGYYQYDGNPGSDNNPDPYYSSYAPSGRSYLVWEPYSGYFSTDVLTEAEWLLEVFVEPLVSLPQCDADVGVWLSSITQQAGLKYWQDEILCPK
ncbi:MAG: hypothetical protein ABH878_07350 [bacterium]